MDLDNCFKTYWRIRKKWASQPTNFYWGDHIDARYFLIFMLLDNFHGKRILDIGAGTGVILSELSESNLRIGIDNDDNAILYGRKIDKSIVYLKADKFLLPFKRGSFDAIFLNSMLPLFLKEELRNIVHKVWELLKYGGTLYITMANKDSISYKNLENALNYKEIYSLLSENFKAINVRFYNIIPNFPFGPPNAFYNLLLYNKFIFKLVFKFLAQTSSRKAKWLIVSAGK